MNLDFLREILRDMVFLAEDTGNYYVPSRETDKIIEKLKSAGIDNPVLNDSVSNILNRLQNITNSNGSRESRDAPPPWTSEDSRNFLKTFSIECLHPGIQNNTLDVTLLPQFQDVKKNGINAGRKVLFFLDAVPELAQIAGVSLSDDMTRILKELTKKAHIDHANDLTIKQQSVKGLMGDLSLLFAINEHLKRAGVGEEVLNQEELSRSKEHLRRIHLEQEIARNAEMLENARRQFRYLQTCKAELDPMRSPWIKRDEGKQMDYLLDQLLSSKVRSSKLSILRGLIPASFSMDDDTVLRTYDAAVSRYHLMRAAELTNDLINEEGDDSNHKNPNWLRSLFSNAASEISRHYRQSELFRKLHPERILEVTAGLKLCPSGETIETQINAILIEKINKLDMPPP